MGAIQSTTNRRSRRSSNSHTSKKKVKETNKHETDTPPKYNQQQAELATPDVVAIPSEMSETRFLRPARILMLGAPGAGKGTYATRLSSMWRIPHIGTGDMIRDEIKKGTELGKKFKEFTSKGLLIPDDAVNEIARIRLSSPDVLADGYILDGYPRTEMQAKCLDSFAKPHICIHITLPDEFLIQKIAGRRICRQCGVNYNVANIKDGKYDMPALLPSNDPNRKCKCTDLYQRDDDREDVVIDRLNIYKNETSSLIDHYTRQKILKSFEVFRGVADLPQLADVISSTLEGLKKTQEN